MSGHGRWQRSLRLEDAARDLHDAAFKVVVHWKDFRSFQTYEEALDVLRQQAPETSDEAATLVLDALARFHDRAVDALPSYVRRRLKLLPFATSGDIDQQSCMAELAEIAPNLPLELKEDMLGWVVHWHWER